MEPFPDGVDPLQSLVAPDLSKETPDWCTNCQALRTEIRRLEEQQVQNFGKLKKKIISTDLLIKKYKTKCEDYDTQQRKVEEANKRADKYQRQTEILETQLKSALLDVEPVRKSNAMLEEEVKQKTIEMQKLSDNLIAAEGAAYQYEHLTRNSSATIERLEAEKKDLQQKIKVLESGKVSKDAAREFRNEISTLKKENMTLSRSEARLEKKLKAAVTKIELLQTKLKDNKFSSPTSRRRRTSSGGFLSPGRSPVRSPRGQKTSATKSPSRSPAKTKAVNEREEKEEEETVEDAEVDFEDIEEQVRAAADESDLDQPNTDDDAAGDSDSGDTDDAASMCSVTWTFSPMVKCLSPLPPTPYGFSAESQVKDRPEKGEEEQEVMGDLETVAPANPDEAIDEIDPNNATEGLVDMEEDVKPMKEETHKLSGNKVPAVVCNSIEEKVPKSRETKPESIKEKLAASMEIFSPTKKSEKIRSVSSVEKQSNESNRENKIPSKTETEIDKSKNSKSDFTDLNHSHYDSIDHIKNKEIKKCNMTTHKPEIFKKNTVEGMPVQKNVNQEETDNGLKFNPQVKIVPDFPDSKGDGFISDNKKSGSTFKLDSEMKKIDKLPTETELLQKGGSHKDKIDKEGFDIDNVVNANLENAIIENEDKKELNAFKNIQSRSFLQRQEAVTDKENMLNSLNKSEFSEGRVHLAPDNVSVDNNQVSVKKVVPIKKISENIFNDEIESLGNYNEYEVLSRNETQGLLLPENVRGKDLKKQRRRLRKYQYKDMDKEVAETKLEVISDALESKEDVEKTKHLQKQKGEQILEKGPEKNKSFDKANVDSADKPINRVSSRLTRSKRTLSDSGHFLAECDSKDSKKEISHSKEADSDQDGNDQHDSNKSKVSDGIKGVDTPRKRGLRSARKSVDEKRTPDIAIENKIVIETVKDIDGDNISINTHLSSHIQTSDSINIGVKEVDCETHETRKLEVEVSVAHLKPSRQSSTGFVVSASLDRMSSTESLNSPVFKQMPRLGANEIVCDTIKEVTEDTSKDNEKALSALSLPLNTDCSDSKSDEGKSIINVSNSENKGSDSNTKQDIAVEANAETQSHIDDKSAAEIKNKPSSVDSAKDDCRASCSYSVLDKDKDLAATTIALGLSEEVEAITKLISPSRQTRSEVVACTPDTLDSETELLPSCPSRSTTPSISSLDRTSPLSPLPISPFEFVIPISPLPPSPQRNIERVSPLSPEKANTDDENVNNENIPDVELQESVDPEVNEDNDTLNTEEDRENKPAVASQKSDKIKPVIGDYEKLTMSPVPSIISPIKTPDTKKVYLKASVKSAFTNVINKHGECSVLKNSSSIKKLVITNVCDTVKEIKEKTSKISKKGKAPVKFSSQAPNDVVVVKPEVKKEKSKPAVKDNTIKNKDEMENKKQSHSGASSVRKEKDQQMKSNSRIEVKRATEEIVVPKNKMGVKSSIEKDQLGKKGMSEKEVPVKRQNAEVPEDAPTGHDNLVATKKKARLAHKPNIQPLRANPIQIIDAQATLPFSGGRKRKSLDTGDADGKDKKLCKESLFARKPGSDGTDAKEMRQMQAYLTSSESAESFVTREITEDNIDHLASKMVDTCIECLCRVRTDPLGPVYNHFLSSGDNSIQGDWPFLNTPEKQALGLFRYLQVTQELGLRLSQVLLRLWEGIFSPTLSVGIGGQMVLCCVFTALCAAEGDLEQARVLVYQIATCARLHLSQFVLPVVSVWPEVLRKHPDDQPDKLLTHGMVLVLERHVTRMLQEQPGEDSKKVQEVLRKLCGWSGEAVDPDVVLRHLISRLAEAVDSKDNSGVLFETIKAMQLMSVTEGWDWFRQLYILRHGLQSVSNKYMSKTISKPVSPAYVCAIISIIGPVTSSLSASAKKKDLTKLVKTWLLPMMSKQTGETTVRDCCLDTILELSPIHPPLLHLLQAWAKGQGNVLTEEARKRIATVERMLQTDKGKQTQRP